MCVPITGQMAACEALHSGSKSIEEMRREYNRRREFVVEELKRLGLECQRPQGTFYVFPCIKSTAMKSLDFCRDLLKKQKVAVVPGSAFGNQFEDYIRISYASSYENLKEAFARIKKFLSEE